MYLDHLGVFLMIKDKLVIFKVFRLTLLKLFYKKDVIFSFKNPSNMLLGRGIYVIILNICIIPINIIYIWTYFVNYMDHSCNLFSL